ncbi:MAG: hypothetical protein MJE77_23155 [Proteobacteria bacterium]|nr:hypothetical protein [Pseudomonadota bacterium]
MQSSKKPQRYDHRRGTPGWWLRSGLITAIIALAGCGLWDAADANNGKITVLDDERGESPSHAQSGDGELPDPSTPIPEYGDRQSVCLSDGWCWDNPWPQGHSLHGVWGASRDNIFAVGDKQTILHYDGERWSLMETPAPPVHFVDVWGRSGDDVYALATPIGAVRPPSFAIYHYDGTAWQLLSKGRGSRMTAIWGIGTDELLANNQRMVRRPSGQWTWQMEPGLSNGIQDFWGDGQGIIVAVGEDGEIFRHDGEQWSPMDSGTSADLLTVWGSSADNVFAAGSDGTLLHYDGAGWTPFAQNPNLTISTLWGDGPDDAYALGFSPTPADTPGKGSNSACAEKQGYESKTAVGYTTLLRYDGSDWKAVLAIAGQTRANSMWGVNGQYMAVGNAGNLVLYDGTSWITTYRSATWRNLIAVWSDGETAFAVGSGGTIVRHDGRQWHSMATPTSQALYGVWGTSADNVFAVGDSGTVLHYDGREWQAVDLSTSEDLCAVDGSSSDDIYVGGAHGTLFRYDGERWTQMATGQDFIVGNLQVPEAEKVLASVYTRAWPGYGWTGATDTAIWQFDSAGWHKVFTPPADQGYNSRSVFELSSNGPADIISVGREFGRGGVKDPPIMRYDGVQWQLTAEHVPMLGYLQGISGRPGDTYAVGRRTLSPSHLSSSEGVIVHSDGSRVWTRHNQAYRIPSMHDVWSSATETHAIAVGLDGTILRRR